MERWSRKLLVGLAAAALVAAACGDGDTSEPSTTTASPSTTTVAGTSETTAAPTTAAPEPEAPAGTEATAPDSTAAAVTETTEAVMPDTTAAPPDWGAADFNGDGVVRIAVVTDGPRDDGAYYQALVEWVEDTSAKADYEPPLIVDEVEQANAREELETIVSQAVDIIAIGSSGIADGNEDLFLEYEEIFWYCNCGSGFQDTPGMLRSADSGAELNISAGYATGLLIQERGGDSAVFLGCCDLNFEVESFTAFEYGLQLVDASFSATYVPTGNFAFDFNNTAGATEAYNTAVAEGVAAVYPFLGGAHEAIVQLANSDGLIVMTAGSSRGCERDDLAYDLEVMFDAGDYIAPIFTEILNGTALEGGVRRFTVGIDPEVGADFCNATAEQEAALADLNARIGAGDFNNKIYEILAGAYGF